jgi:hypothetical protein
VKEFFAQYALNLWVYGTQALCLFFAVRKVWQYQNDKKEERQQQFKGVGVVDRRPDNLRNERAG